MRRIGFFFSMFLALVVILASPPSPQAGGLRTQLGEVAIENLQVGQTYNLRQLANLSLIVTNTSDVPVHLVMEVLRPDSSELKAGSEPVPDCAWVKLSQTAFALAEGENALSDILISVPNSDQYLGRRYQVSIWSHTLGDSAGGMSLAYGLKSRIIFSTDTVRAGRGDVVTSSTASTDFTLKPEEVFLANVEGGKTYDVEKESGVLLNITNRSEHHETIRLVSRSVRNSSTTLTTGFEDTPDASYLRFGESEFTLPPRGIKAVRMYLEFPEKAEYAGKRYMFVIHAYTTGEKVIAGVYSRLYAATK